MNDGAPRHPQDQTMAAFIDGTLAPHEIAEVAAHLRGCDECRVVVAESARFERDEAKRPRARWWIAAAAVIAAIAIGVPFMRRDTSPIAQLIAASPKEHRRVEARLSGFPWARLQAPSRGEETRDPADLKLDGAAGEVLDKKTDAHANGVAYLLIDQRDDAIANLDRAATQSNDPRTWSDLAAARYATAVRDDHPAQLPQALADADRALRLAPKLPEALFNRALILERMGLREAAQKAWQRYLEIDAGSAWSVEARERLAKLTGRSSRKFDPKMLETVPADQLVREFPYEARKWSEGPMLVAWGDDPNQSPDRARIIGRSLASFNGEQFVSDAIAAIDRADASQRGALAEGHHLFGEARAAYQQRRAGEAETMFRRAAQLFAAGGSPMSGLATFYAANAAFDQNRSSEAREELIRLRGSVDRNRHRALVARISRLLAVIANGSGDLGTAVREADAASSIFHALGEQSCAADVDAVSAHALELIGDRDSAWTRRIRALDALCDGNDRALCGDLLSDGATALMMIYRAPAALALIDAAIDPAGRAEPATEALRSVKRARVALRAVDLPTARTSLDQARASLVRIAERALRETTEVQVNIEEAAMLQSADPAGAISALNRAVKFLTGRQTSYLLPHAYLQRARAFRSAKDDRAALGDYRAALDEIEKQRTRIGEGAMQSAFLDTAADVIDETIDLELSGGAIDAAFDVADRRHLITTVATSREPRATTGVAIIEYAVLPRSLVTFFISADGITATRRDIDRRELARQIESLGARIRERAPIEQIKSASSKLYDILIAPFSERLTGVDEVVVIADRELFALPFSALYDARHDRYLIQDFAIRLAPAFAEAPTAATRSLKPALVVADPPAAGLPRLAGGRDEAERIASMQAATLLSGDAATRERFVAAARESALIHFAGHAESSAIKLYGALRFADDGVLTESDIARMRLDRHPLVILAACGTFRGDAVHVAGMPSIARAFLIAGAREVVGTLWEIDDDSSATLFLHFHDSLHSGRATAAALRDAQLTMLQSSDARLRHPATWSPIALITNAV